MASDAEWLDWIKQLPAHKTVGQISETVGLDSHAVAGRLLTLWEWDDRRYEDGQADQQPVSAIDEIVRCDGFAQALLDSGWMVQQIGGVEFPAFERYRKDQEQNREKTRKRVSRHRDRKRLEEQAKVIYKAYPRAGAPRRAVNAILRAFREKRVEPDALLCYIKLYAEERASEDEQFTPLCSRWVNDDGWEALRTQAASVGPVSRSAARPRRPDAASRGEYPEDDSPLPTI